MPSRRPAPPAPPPAPDAAETSLPARNFTISLDQRVRAMGGPPAYVRRRRHIEDLEAEILDDLAEVRLEAAAALGASPDAVDDAEVLRRVPRAILKQLAALNELIEKHNRYYPAEANLPMNPRTGALLERVGGPPWAPLPPATIEILVARSGARPRG